VNATWQLEVRLARTSVANGARTCRRRSDQFADTLRVARKRRDSAGNVGLRRAALAGGRLGGMSRSLLVVHVHCQVLIEHVDAFVAATLDNARHSLEEPGIVRFDVAQQRDDPSRFVLVEVYLDPEAPAAHKQTAHYQRWRDSVAPMMAAPRSSLTYTNVHPDDGAW
jgi:quinol monooxygenase YgiN